MICTNNFFPFDPKNPSCKYGSLLTERKYLAYQLPIPRVMSIDDTWDTKLSHGTVCVFQPGAGSEKLICSIKLCFHDHGI